MIHVRVAVKKWEGTKFFFKVCAVPAKFKLNEKKFGGGLWRWSWQLIVHN